MQFFIDTAEVEAIKKAMELGMCDGVTTNPSLILKSQKDHKQVIGEISEVVGERPISVEAISTNSEGMVKEAEEFVNWGKNIVVKLPMTKEGLKATRILSEKGIKVNITLIFSASQALLAAKAGASYVSPFVGRLDDISEDGMELVESIIDIYENYDFETEIIVASIRDPIHVVESARLGADIATIPSAVMEKLWKHPLTDAGVKKFLEDYEKSRK